MVRLFHSVVPRCKFVLLDEDLLERQKGVELIEHEHRFAVRVLIYTAIGEWSALILSTGEARVLSVAERFG